MSIKQTIKDYKAYLDEIEKLSTSLNKEQKEKLKNILSVQLTMLVCLKQSSNLGKLQYRFIEDLFKGI